MRFSSLLHDAALYPSWVLVSDEGLLAVYVPDLHRAVELQDRMRLSSLLHDAPCT